MQTVSEINNYPEPKFWRHLAIAINRFLTASQFRYFSIATRFRHFWRHLASAIRRFLTASQFRYFSIATRFSLFLNRYAIFDVCHAKLLRLISVSPPQDSPPQARFLRVKVDGLKMKDYRGRAVTL